MPANEPMASPAPDLPSAGLSAGLPAGLPGGSRNADARRALLRDLAAALTRISERLRSLETTKRMIFLLAARAETIAEQAMRLATMQGGDPTQAARDLGEQTRDFASGFGALSERIARDISAERNLAGALIAHAADLLRQVAATETSASGQIGRLQPLAESLAGLAGRRKTDKSLATETSALADRANGLAKRAETMAAGANARDMKRTSADLHQNLRAMADDAATVSQQIEAEATMLTAAVSVMAAAAERLVRQDTATPRADPPTARIQRIVRNGQAAMDW